VTRLPSAFWWLAGILSMLAAFFTLIDGFFIILAWAFFWSFGKFALGIATNRQALDASREP
jgi:hypothetical protein